MTVYIFMGNIGSRKSTYAKELAQQGAIVVNRDAIVTLVHGGDYTLYDRKLEKLYKHIEHEIFHYAMSLGKDVVIDKTNTTVKRRRKWIDFARQYQAKTVAVVFYDQGEGWHIQNRMQDPRGISEEQWRRVYWIFHEQLDWHHMRLEEEGFDEIYIQDLTDP